MTDLTRAMATVHGGKGTFIRTPEQIERDHRAAEMRSLGYTYGQIGEALGVSRQAAHQAVQRAIKEIPTEGAEAVRQVELLKIDRLERYYHTVLGRTHVRVGNTGKVVKDDDGAVILDEAPRMEAAAGILKCQAQRARLLGLNAPVVSKSELMIYDVDRDSAQIIEAQMMALKVMGLDDRLEEFRDVFIAALGSGTQPLDDSGWIEAEVVVP